MMWLLVAILLIVLIISLSKGNKKKNLEIEVLKKEIEDPKSDSVISVSDELIKLKSLLDSGVLTQEEFDRQKHKLLNK